VCAPLKSTFRLNLKENPGQRAGIFSYTPK